jgi:hypothetical protein
MLTLFASGLHLADSVTMLDTPPNILAREAFLEREFVIT